MEDGKGDGENDGLKLSVHERHKNKSERNSKQQACTLDIIVHIN